MRFNKIILQCVYDFVNKNCINVFNKNVTFYYKDPSRDDQLHQIQQTRCQCRLTSFGIECSLNHLKRVFLWSTWYLWRWETSTLHGPDPSGWYQDAQIPLSIEASLSRYVSIFHKYNIGKYVILFIDMVYNCVYIKVIIITIT